MGNTLCASMLVFLSLTKSTVVKEFSPPPGSLSIMSASPWVHAQRDFGCRGRVSQVRQANQELHDIGARRDPLKDDATEGERKEGFAPKSPSMWMKS